MSGTLLPFLVASVLLVAVPGPNVVYILTRAANLGRRAGIVSALGVETGTLVHVAAAALGVSAVVAATPVALTVLTYAGAGYLVYLAVRAWRSRGGPELSGAAGETSLLRVFRAGLLVNVLNPKVVLFFLAFLPQFVTVGPGAPSARAQMFVLGVLFLVPAFVLDLCYAFAGAVAGRWLTRSGRATAGATATVYCGLAGYALLS